MAKQQSTTMSKSEKQIRRIWFFALLIMFLITFILAYKERQKLLNPDGEYGVIHDTEIIELSENGNELDAPASSSSTFDISQIPEYSGTPTYALNGNRPFYTDEDFEKAKQPFIELAELDKLGRCGVCWASLGQDTMPTEERDFDLSSVKPSGWKQAFYPDIIEMNDGALYHRSHLIAWKLSGIEAESRALITGTEQLNETAMLPYCEKGSISWLAREGGRILYRATPVFEDYNLVCSGVLLEGADVETKGERFHFCIWCYNVQDGIKIDYLTGRSWRE